MDIVLVHPEIPHNTGAIGRLCVGLGWPLCLIDSFEDYLRARRPNGLCFLSTKAERSLYDVPLAPDGALVFGSESSGLPPDFYPRYRDRLAAIPMPGPHARSINLANAVAIAAYEAHRRFR